MPFNGSGTFNPVYIWTLDAQNGIKILASRQDTQWSDACTNGLSNCVTRDGQSPATANLPMGGFKHTGAADGSAATDYATYGQLTNTVGALTGALGGLTLSTAGSSATFGIAVGAALDSTGALFMKLASAFTKTTAAWAAGTGVGSLDTGAIAINTTYHVFLIGGPTLTPDILISLSPTVPTMPGAYTLFRRIGSMITNASSQWTLFTQVANRFLLSAPVSNVNAGTAGATTAITRAVSVPTGIKVEALLTINIIATSANSAVLYASSFDQTDLAAATSTGAFTLSATSIGASGAASVSGQVSIRTNTSAQIRLRFQATDTFYDVATYGWIDTRGQG